MRAEQKLRQGAILIAVTGAGIVGYGGSFLYTTYLGTDFELGVRSLGGVTRAGLAGSNPAMLQYMDHLHVGLGGLLVTLGITLVALGWYGIRAGYRWAVGTSLLIALLALATNGIVHYQPGFGYDWLVHIAPSLGVTVLVIIGGVRAYQGLSSGADAPTHGG